MDIQKEKIAHEKHLLSQGVDFKYLPNIQYNELENVYELIEWGEEYSEALNEINSSWCTWQAAKAHEAEKLKGCVLVPVQCPDPDFADSLFDELSKKAIGEFGDDLLIHFSDIDEEKIWALMVEAAKAQAAPEGFILVDKHQLAQLMANMDSFGKKALGDDYVSFADIAEVLDEAREPAND